MVDYIAISASPVLLLEHWKPVEGFEGVYEVSSVGRVRRIKLYFKKKSPGFLKATTRDDGYQVVRLSDGLSHRDSPYLHDVVALAFLGPRPPGMEVNHINPDKTINRASNLEYVTSKGNKDHARLHDLSPIGERHGGAKLTEDQVRHVRSLKGLAKQQRLADELGISRQTVSDIQIGRRWKHIA